MTTTTAPSSAEQMPELPFTDYALFFEAPGDDQDEGYQEVVDAPGYTAAQMRVYARAYAAQEVAQYKADAERYRFLCDYCSGEPRVGGIAPCINLYGLQDAPEEEWNETATATNHLTETIDAAIRARHVAAVTGK